MKRKILFIISTIMVCVGLAACGTSDSGSESENKVDKAEEKESKMSKKIHEDKYVVLKLDSIKSDGIYMSVKMSVKNKTNQEISISDEWTMLDSKGYPTSGSILEIPPKATIDYEYSIEIKSKKTKTYQAKFELWNSDNEEIKKITTKKIKTKLR